MKAEAESLGVFKEDQMIPWVSIQQPKLKFAGGVCVCTSVCVCVCVCVLISESSHLLIIQAIIPFLSHNLLSFNLTDYVVFSFIFEQTSVG